MNIVFQNLIQKKTAQTIDEEVSKLIESAYIKTKQLLIDNKPQLDLLATRLLEREVLFKEDLEEIFGKRPFDIEVEETKFVELPNNQTSLPESNLNQDSQSQSESSI